jgi:hypothetical protein
MKWRVIWQPEAGRRLTELWLASRRRQAITESAYEFDAILALNPEDAGESREENRRVVLIEPLGARIQIDIANRTVSVLTVWDY